MRISPLPPTQLKEAFSFAEVDFTGKKTKKVAEAILGGFSFFLASYLLLFSGNISFLTLPLYFVSLVIGIRFFQSEKYGDEKQLEFYRKKAREETFAQTARHHGLANIFQHNLLPKDLLSEKLRAHLNWLHPEGIALLYLEFQKATEDFENFSAIFEGAMERAVTGLKASELFENPYIDSILLSGLVSLELPEAERVYKEQKQIRAENYEAFQREFSNEFDRHLDLFEEHLRKAKSNDILAQQWMSNMQHDVSELRGLDCLAEASPIDHPLLQPCHKNWPDIQFVTDTHAILLKAYYRAHDTYLKKVKEANQHFKSVVARIDAEFIS